MTGYPVTTISFTSIEKPHGKVWYVTFNGRVLGDSRGYDRDGARAEALRIVDADHALTTREGRMLHTKIYKPG